MLLPEPGRGLLSDARNGMVRGDTLADKARDFTGKGRLGREQEGEGAQETCCAAWPLVSGFRAMGLASWLPLANLSYSEPFLGGRLLLSQGGCQQERFREVMGHTMSPPDCLEFVRLVVTC